MLFATLLLTSLGAGEPGGRHSPGDSGSAAASDDAADPPVAERDNDGRGYETVVKAKPRPTEGLPEHAATTVIERAVIERRLPRSAPDALRFEPGVYVQKTAHGQGSAFIRGMTGQQTLLLFDGVRLNNSTYRQGPNQYFFTLDSQSIESLAVLRGGASTGYGSDALGGVLLARPIEPRFGESGGLSVTPNLRLRGATADGETGGRLHTNVAWGQRVAFVGGVGGRRVGLLRSGGRLPNLTDGDVALTPRVKDDGRTQLGTGFDEVTADGRLALRVGRKGRVVLSAYTYRQMDAPRTDQCPNAYAAAGDCLVYDDQFRTLAYVAYDQRSQAPWLRSLRAHLSWQQQRERRTNTRKAARNVGRDVVDTFGVRLKAASAFLPLGDDLRLRVEYGADNYHDRVRSAAWTSLTNVGVTREDPRGQYVEGSTYTYGGAFAQAEARTFGGVLRVVGGSRIGWARARVAADLDSATQAVARTWTPLVGFAGARVALSPHVVVRVRVDRSFRAPNLDDVSSRQQTGPGFQIENPDLRAERSTSAEVGVRLSAPVVLDVWLFRTLLHDAIGKVLADGDRCPPGDEGCSAAWTQITLANRVGDTELRGVEALAELELPADLALRAQATWTWGQFPGGEPKDRVPPLNGSVELTWASSQGLTLSGAVRFARPQKRLALIDISDTRIPAGGTRGFVVADLRALYRASDGLRLALAFENVTDEAYRYHGSSVNQPGRGLALMLEMEL